MSSIRNIEQTSLKSKVLHIGLGIIFSHITTTDCPQSTFC